MVGVAIVWNSFIYMFLISFFFPRDANNKRRGSVVCVWRVPALLVWIGIPLLTTPWTQDCIP